MSSSSNCSDRLYVGGFSMCLTTEQIKTMINEASLPFEIKIDVVENGARKHRGFAFVQCKNQTEAALLLSKLSLIFSKINFAKREHNPPETIMSNISNVFIRGLSKDLNDSELFEAFGGVPDGVVQCHVADGYGFVLFDSRNNAEKKISEMNGAVLKGQKIAVMWARPDIHGRKRKRPCDESIPPIIDNSPISMIKRSTSYPMTSNTNQQQVLNFSPGQPYSHNPFQLFSIPTAPTLFNSSLFLPSSLNFSPSSSLHQNINAQIPSSLLHNPYLNLLL